MKIASSQVAMASSHELETNVSVKKASLEVRAENGAQAKKTVAAIYESTGMSAVSAMEHYREEYFKKAEKPTLSGQPEHGAQHRPPELTLGMRTEPISFEISDEDEMKISLLRKLLEALNGKKGERYGDFLDLRGGAAREASARSQRFSVSTFSVSVSASALLAARGAAREFSGGGTLTPSGGTLWQRVNAVSTERSEREHTAFRSKGLAVTEDGRSISFNVEVAMSRSFTERFDALSSEQFVLTDPLVINLDSNTTSVSDMKFSFDLDGDGEQENISFAGKGSGFLALDRDGNGKIDDGSELFGTKSGDGFADLAAYDSDGNGWIDENDDVYAKLRVWVKDADGGDRLLDLKKADVGAIYLGSADTEFSLKDAATNETEAVIRKTGVYLKESGGAGTVSHVDLRC